MSYAFLDFKYIFLFLFFINLINKSWFLINLACKICCHRIKFFMFNFYLHKKLINVLA